MRKLISTIAAALVAATLASGGAYAFGPPFFSGPLQLGDILGALNKVVQYFQQYTGMVAALPGPVASTATTAEQTFATTSLPGGTLTLAGQTLVIRCGGTTASDGNSKTAHLYFGTEEISTQAMTIPGQTWDLELVVTAVTATANSAVMGRGFYGAFVVTPIEVNDLTDNLSNGVTAKCTGTQGTASAADMTEENFIIWQEK